MRVSTRSQWVSCVLALLIALVPLAGSAQTGLSVTGGAVAACDVATFSFEVEGGSGMHDLALQFGDGESAQMDDVSSYPVEFEHVYAAAGSYGWSLIALDSADASLAGEASGELIIGPTVELTSDPFPPLLTLEGGAASIDFTALVDGGLPPYSYSWDLDGDGVEDAGSDSGSASASFSYDAPGNFQATVTVTDDCGLSQSDELAVVVFDPENACHPMAERIAESVSQLFPDQLTQLYSCDDIFAMFNGALTGSQLGFGRMWHAYKLALTMEELTWEEILDWHLEQTGWGRLSQLDRLGSTLADVGLRELFDLVISGEATVKDVFLAGRAAARFEAEFADALMRVQSGANAGELNQFYRLAEALELDPVEVDAYLATGVSLAELRQGARISDRYGSDLDAVLSAKSNGASWGEIQQAERLADDGTSAQSILEQGVQEYRRQLRDSERRSRAASRYAQQFGVSLSEAEAAYDACNGDNKCIRDMLSSATAGASSQDDRTAAQLARQYGVAVAQVWQVYNGSCAGDWKCVRSYFREQNQGNHGQGNNQ